MIGSHLYNSLKMSVIETAFAEREAAKDAEIARLKAPVARKQFPILGSGGVKIDWQIVEDHGKQALANHYQTVERLSERGGLSWCELHAVLHNRPWQKMDENTAIEECRAVEATYLSAMSPDQATITSLRADVVDLVGALVGALDGLLNMWSRRTTDTARQLVAKHGASNA